MALEMVEDLETEVLIAVSQILQFFGMPVC